MTVRWQATTFLIRRLSASIVRIQKFRVGAMQFWLVSVAVSLGATPCRDP